ncbi:hypothetical protein QQM39_22785 [Streptomyces sp. DT2A-34]|uniref:hypothetical protein n=1 Tax=Streptomyces sp. DT2A-34 TaxID=3051182 RepID=UPI00265BC573|nr:hypothetical protein [Streptomyces sp. DT2A-34]MDO0913566.1 hypothetical protein [Streptomyces sp. DT2A-34]
MAGRFIVIALFGWALVGTVLAFVLSSRLISKFAESARALPDDVGNDVRQQRSRQLSREIAPARRVLTSALVCLLAAIAITLLT